MLITVLKTLRNAYKDKEASERFVAKKLAVFTIYDKLRASYNKSLGFWTKEQLNFDKYSHFPQPLPDAFMTMTPEGPRPRDRYFFLNYLDDKTPFFVHVRRIQKYLDYVESGEWEDVTSTKVRGVLLICESTSLLKRVRKKLALIVGEDEVPRFLLYDTGRLKAEYIGG